MRGAFSSPGVLSFLGDSIFKIDETNEEMHSLIPSSKR